MPGGVAAAPAGARAAAVGQASETTTVPFRHTRVEDGGGWPSTADWISPAGADPFSGLRAKTLEMVHTPEFMARLLVYGSGGAPTVKDEFGDEVTADFFTPAETSQLRQLALEELSAAGIQTSLDVDWGQPFLLDLLEGFSVLTGDPDTELIPTLRAGVPIGVGEPVRSSGLFRERSDLTPAEGEDELFVLAENWQGANDDPEVTLDLVTADVKHGWAIPLDGGLDEARARWGDRVADMKLNVVKAGGKKPRLIGDPTKSGVSAAATIEESCPLPQVYDLDAVLRRHGLLASFWLLMVVDVLAAHKRVKIRPADQGLCLLSISGRWYYYACCFFGLKASAYWWGRVSALLTRLVHKVIHSPHAALNYVDDLLVVLRTDLAMEQALMVVSFFAMIGLPISWSKFRLGQQLVWLGFALDFRAEFRVALTAVKKEKLVNLLSPLTVSGHKILRRDLESLIGLLMWFTTVARLLRPFLFDFYRILHKPRCVQKQLPQWLLEEVLAALDGSMVVCRRLVKADVHPGWKLWKLGNSLVETPRDCWDVCWRHEGAMARFEVPDDGWTSTDGASALSAKLFLRMVQQDRSWLLGPAQPMPGLAFADAWASHDVGGMGGWFSLCDDPGPHDIWYFHIPVTLASLPKEWGVSRGTSLQKVIATLELIAQLVLLALRLDMATGHDRRWSTCIACHQMCDNQPVVSATGKWLSCSRPLGYALQALAFLCLQHDVRLRLAHVAGVRNEWADLLSRLNDPEKLPAAAGFLQQLLPEKELQSAQARMLSALRDPWCR